MKRREFVVRGMLGAGAAAAGALHGSNLLAAAGPADPQAGAVRGGGGPVVISSANGMEAVSIAAKRLRGGGSALDAVIEGVEAVYPLARVMPHPSSRAFTMIGLPNDFPRTADCEARSRGEAFTGQMSPDYGNAYGMLVRFKTEAGEAPVLRTLWEKENNTWRITVYDVEAP